jgi:signal transduction histidine kinase
MFYQTGWFYALWLLRRLFRRVRIVANCTQRHVRSQFALVLAERIRMSRAIHDTLLQGLAGPRTSARRSVARSRLGANRHFASGCCTCAVASRTPYGKRAIRIWDLRSPVMESRTFPEALREMGQRVIDGRPITLDMLVTGTPQRCSTSAEEQLLLICQGGCDQRPFSTASRRNVGVDLEYSGEAVRVRVRDDGCGFDPAAVDAADGHYGVISMKERAAQVRGRLTIATTPGQGTQVEAVVPST